MILYSLKPPFHTSAIDLNRLLGAYYRVSTECMGRRAPDSGTSGRRLPLVFGDILDPSCIKIDAGRIWGGPFSEAARGAVFFQCLIQKVVAGMGRAFGLEGVRPRPLAVSDRGLMEFSAQVTTALS